MKLLNLLCAAVVANDASKDRAFSNYPPFLTDGSEKQTWKQNGGNIAKYNRLQPAVKLFYDEFFGVSTSKKAQRFGDHMRRLMEDVRQDFKKQVARCDRRSKRAASELPNDPTKTDAYVLPVHKGIKKGYEALFYQHARWAREEIYWDCPMIGMRIVCPELYTKN